MQCDAASNSAANIYPSDKYDFFPVILSLTNHETPYNLNIVLSFHPPFEPMTALFTIKGLCPFACFFYLSLRLDDSMDVNSLCPK